MSIPMDPLKTAAFLAPMLESALRGEGFLDLDALCCFVEDALHFAACRLVEQETAELRGGVLFLAPGEPMGVPDEATEAVERELGVLNGASPPVVSPLIGGPVGEA
ncbi:MAG: hypothetical protein H6739_38030 [Alphaproteobacteria bacterium]|nr:hypothetical protein [Alphaproteobacteria bacterium]